MVKAAFGQNPQGKLFIAHVRQTEDGSFEAGGGESVRPKRGVHEIATNAQEPNEARQELGTAQSPMCDGKADRERSPFLE